MKISYDGTQNKPSNIILARPGEKRICYLNSIDPDSGSLQLNLKDLSTISFKIDKYIFDEYDLSMKPANGYDIIDVAMELHVENFGWFKIVDPPQIDNDGYIETKQITAESIETELQTKNIIGFKVNRGTNDSQELLIEENRNDLGNGLVLPKRRILLHDGDPKYSLLDILLDGTYWTVGHVDKELISNQDGTEVIGSFEVDNSNIYSILVNDVSNAYECVIVFDNDNFTVNAYSLNAVNVLNRGVFKDTNIVLGFRGVQNSLSRSPEKEIYTVYNVRGGDDLEIRYVNFGSNYVENLDYFLNTKYMPESLINKYIYWRQYKEGQRDSYIAITRQYNEQLDVVSEIENRVPSAGLQTDWTKIDNDGLLASYSNYKALKAGYESTYVDEKGDFDLEAIKLSTDWIDYNSTVTYVIPAIENEIALRGLDSNIGDNGNVDYDYNAWETDWDLYGVSELKVKIADYDERLKSLADNGFDKEYSEDSKYTSEYFNKMHEMYIKYKEEREKCEAALSDRRLQLDTENQKLKDIGDTRQAIVSDVSQDNPRFNFTKDDTLILWKLYNEIDYENDNIFITSLDTASTTIDVQHELLKDAIADLEAYSQPQYKYSSTLDNMLALYDYRMFHEDLNCGNYIHVMDSDDHQIKLRVISMSLNPFLWENDLSIEYSNMLRTKSGWTDKTDILNKTGNQKANSITGTKNPDGIDITSQLINAIINSNQFKNYSQNLTNNIIGISGTSGGQATLTLEELKAKLAQIDQLEANSAFIKYLETELISSDRIVTEILDADEASIEVLASKISNSLYLNANHITGVNAEFAKLIAKSLTFNDLNGGVIRLSDSLFIQDENGDFVIDSTGLSIYDTDSDGEKYVGVQLGYDTQGKPSLILRDESGATILDRSGLKEDGIADDLIINRMIRDNEITGNKVDWTSVGATVDKNGNVSWSSGSVSYNNESLDTVFSRIETRVDEIETINLYDMEILTSNGMVLTRKNPNTTLIAKLLKNGEDATLEFQNNFVWTRASANEESDKEWNINHSESCGYYLQLTRSDVAMNAVFTCQCIYDGELLASKSIS